MTRNYRLKNWELQILKKVTFLRIVMLNSRYVTHSNLNRACYENTHFSFVGMKLCFMGSYSFNRLFTKDSLVARQRQPGGTKLRTFEDKVLFILVSKRPIRCKSLDIPTLQHSY
jgi:hypothetical protein